jgi:hypothetical protein
VKLRSPPGRITHNCCVTTAVLTLGFFVSAGDVLPGSTIGVLAHKNPEQRGNSGAAQTLRCEYYSTVGSKIVRVCPVLAFSSNVPNAETSPSFMLMSQNVI